MVYPQPYQVERIFDVYLLSITAYKWYILTDICVWVSPFPNIRAAGGKGLIPYHFWFDHQCHSNQGSILQWSSKSDLYQSAKRPTLENETYNSYQVKMTHPWELKNPPLRTKSTHPWEMKRPTLEKTKDPPLSFVQALLGLVTSQIITGCRLLRVSHSLGLFQSS